MIDKIKKYYGQFAEFLKDYGHSKNVNITNLLEVVKSKKEVVFFSGEPHFQTTYKDGDDLFFGWLMKYASILYNADKVPEYAIFLNMETSSIICIKFEGFIRHVCRVVGIVKKQIDGQNPQLLYNGNYIENIKKEGWTKLEVNNEEAFLPTSDGLQKAGLFHFIINPTSFGLDPITAKDISSSVHIMEEFSTEEKDKEVVVKSEDFVHLHVHSQYSLLDGVPNLDVIAQKAYSLGHPGVALTDHGYMFGNYKHQQACNKYGIQAIHGVEAYYVDDQKDKSKRFYYHMTILAMNDTGWSNLVKLMTDAGRNGFYYKPRIDWNSLSKYNEGLIILSGCYKSIVSYHFTSEGRNVDKAVQNMRKLKQLFGDRFYNEVMHIKWDEYDDIVPEMIGVADSEGIKSIVTNDCHYANKSDSEIQSTMLKISTGGKGKGLEFSSSEFYLKPRSEIEVGPITPQMADMTMEILERCKFKLEFEGYKFPKFNIEEAQDYGDFLEWEEKISHKCAEHREKEGVTHGR